MKKLFFLMLLLSILVISCNKEKDLQETLPEGAVLKSASFVSDRKTTTGTVKVVAGVNNTVKLVFENFNTGSGPDVRVWLSPNTSTTAYQEVGTLKAFSGNFSYDLGSNLNYTANNNVLIWCEDVSVLFGHAVLQ